MINPDKNVPIKHYINIVKNVPIKHYINIVNNVPNYYHVKLLLKKNIFNINGLKWPIHVVDYKENEWSPDIFEIQDEYMHPIYGPITLLINKKTYQSYSFVKSALK